MVEQVKFEVRFKLKDNEIKTIKEIIMKMLDILAEKQYVSIRIEELEDELEKEEEGNEEHEEIQEEIEKLEKVDEDLEQQLEKLEEELKQILGISYEMTVLYGHNDGLIRYYPALVINDTDDYEFWIDISPKISVYFNLRSEV